MKLVNSATAMRAAARRCSTRPIDEASRAQAAKPARSKSRRLRCRVSGSGVVRPVASTRALGFAAEGGSPTPRVPITPQRRPAALSAWAVHQAVEVLPLVPVVATNRRRSEGRPYQTSPSAPVAAFRPGSAAMRASSKPKASAPSASTRQAPAPAASAAPT